MWLVLVFQATAVDLHIALWGNNASECGNITFPCKRLPPGLDESYDRVIFLAGVNNISDGLRPRFDCYDLGIDLKGFPINRGGVVITSLESDLVKSPIIDCNNTRRHFNVNISGPGGNFPIIFSNLTLTGGSVVSSGGCLLASPCFAEIKIVNMQFINCTAKQGGAVGLDMYGFSSLLLTNSVFIENSVSSFGGAVLIISDFYQSLSPIQLFDNKFLFNGAESTGGGVVIFFVTPPNCTISRNIFQGNKGGGVLVLNTELLVGLELLLEDNFFQGNTANEYAGFGRAAAVSFVAYGDYYFDCHIAVRRNIFRDHYAYSTAVVTFEYGWWERCVIDFISNIFFDNSGSYNVIEMNVQAVVQTNITFSNCTSLDNFAINDFNLYAITQTAVLVQVSNCNFTSTFQAEFISASEDAKFNFYQSNFESNFNTIRVGIWITSNVAESPTVTVTNCRFVNRLLFFVFTQAFNPSITISSSTVVRTTISVLLDELPTTAHVEIRGNIFRGENFPGVALTVFAGGNLVISDNRFLVTKYNQSGIVVRHSGGQITVVNNSFTDGIFIGFEQQFFLMAFSGSIFLNFSLNSASNIRGLISPTLSPAVMFWIVYNSTVDAVSIFDRNQMDNVFFDGMSISLSCAGRCFNHTVTFTNNIFRQTGQVAWSAPELNSVNAFNWTAQKNYWYNCGVALEIFCPGCVQSEVELEDLFVETNRLVNRPTLQVICAVEEALPVSSSLDFRSWIYRTQVRVNRVNISGIQGILFGSGQVVVTNSEFRCGNDANPAMDTVFTAAITCKDSLFVSQTPLLASSSGQFKFINSTFFLLPQDLDPIYVDTGNLLIDEYSSFICPPGYGIKYSYGMEIPTTSSDISPATYLTSMLAITCLRCPAGTYGFLTGGVMQGGKSQQLDGLWVYPGQCLPCPFGADCKDGGANFGAKPNLWAEAVDEFDFMARCPTGYCCPSSEESCAVNECYGNRMGILCSDCAPLHSLLYFSTACASDAACNFSLYWIGAVFYAMILALWAGFSKSNQHTESNSDEDVKTGFFLIALGFFQSVALVIVTHVSAVVSVIIALGSLQVPPATGGLQFPMCIGKNWTATGKISLHFIIPLLVFGFVFLFWLLKRLNVTSYLCLPRHTNPHSTQSMGVELSQRAQRPFAPSENLNQEPSEPAAALSESTANPSTNAKGLGTSPVEHVTFVSLPRFPCQCYDCINNNNNPKNQKVSLWFKFTDWVVSHRLNISVAILKVCLVGYSTVAKGLLELLKCVPIPIHGSSDGVNHFFQQASLTCTLGRKVGLSIALIPVMLFPFLLILLRRRQQGVSQVESKSTAKLTSGVKGTSPNLSTTNLSQCKPGRYLNNEQLWVLEGPFRDGARFWCTVMLLRHLILVIITLTGDPGVQVILDCLVTLFYLATLLLVQPFRFRFLHMVESSSAIAIHLVALINIRAASNMSAGVVDSNPLTSGNIQGITAALMIIETTTILIITVIFFLVRLSDQLPLESLVTRCVCCSRPCRDRCREWRHKINVSDPECKDLQRVGKPQTSGHFNTLLSA